jgi:hypothetical protein
MKNNKALKYSLTCVLSASILLSQPASLMAGDCSTSKIVDPNSCDNTCSTYEKIQGDISGGSCCPSEYASYCSASDSSCCKNMFDASWGQLGQQCGAYKLYGDAIVYEWITAIAYTATAAVCWVACAEQYLQGLCNAAGLVVSLGDIVGTAVITSDGQQFTEWWHNYLGGYTTGAVGTLAGGAGSYSQFVNGKTPTKGESCFMAGLFTLIAGIKIADLIADYVQKGPACDNVTGFHSTALPVLPTDITTTTQPKAPSLGGVNKGTASGSSMSAELSSKMGSIPNEMDLTDSSSLVTQYALSGPLGDILKHMNRDGISKASSKYLQGGGLKGIASRIANGQGAVAAINGALPDETKSKVPELEGLDKVIKDGYIKLKDPGNATMARAGAGSGAGKSGSSNPFAMFGSKAPGLTGTASNENFQKQKKSAIAEPASDDVFHIGYTGTIFQIVSQKIVKTKDRVDELEWSSPLNRALMGLSAKKDTKQTSGGRK